MGRPSLGVRKQMNVRLPPDLIDKIDAARGLSSRDSWVEKAARLALRPTSIFVQPSLQQDVHVCKFDQLKETVWTDGVRMRKYVCTCGEGEVR